jgi:hypothetical protein
VDDVKHICLSDEMNKELPDAALDINIWMSNRQDAIDGMKYSIYIWDE